MSLLNILKTNKHPTGDNQPPPSTSPKGAASGIFTLSDSDVVNPFLPPTWSDPFDLLRRDMRRREEVEAILGVVFGDAWRFDATMGWWFAETQDGRIVIIETPWGV
jgi:hypothetical protein